MSRMVVRGTVILKHLLYVSGNSKQGIPITLEGWVEEGDGREVQKGGDICIPMADTC